MESLQARQEEGPGDGVARTDGQLPGQELAHLGELLLPVFQEAQGAVDVLKEELPLARERDAPRVPGKEPDLQLLLELADRLAHRGLREIQLLRRGGDVPLRGHRAEDPVKL